ncbi:unnamed protein product [Vicia faba]|uniref:Cullin N-terminal domain-containing protein n=1 Tax=Vicia faba TaxID=3906 RepID=A0AAV1A303_VICFA|nr:unnamed protein product [Vicia faba]
MTDRKTIDLDQGWAYMQNGIKKLKTILEGSSKTQFSSEEYMMLYTTIYNMCTQKPPLDYSQDLYDRYKGFFEEYIRSTVLSSVRDKHDEFMLRELVQRWVNHKVLVRWLSRFFHYLDRYFVVRRSLPPLNEVWLSAFRDLVYMEVRANASKAVITLIDKEREGEQIDRSLLKNILDIFVEIGMGDMKHYENDFEVQMLEDTADYYRKRVSHYLHASTEQKLVEKVQHELLVSRANQLLEKEHSGCRALLRDDKVDYLSRMYRLYHKIPKGLDAVANVFKQHITDEGTTLVQLTEESSCNKKNYKPCYP